MANGDTLRKTTGQLAWNGCNSDKTPTIAGPGNPNGLEPDKFAWMNNCTTRGGAVFPRRGYKRLLRMPVTALFQSAYMYKPDDAFPYIVTSVAGKIYRVRVDTDNSVEDISQGFQMPADQPLGFMVQGEQFLIIQAGDYVTLPLFWDGQTMRRSLGINSLPFGVVGVATVAPAIGGSVVVTLTAPFTGDNGSIITINGKKYQAFRQNIEFITLSNVSSPASVGTVVPAGSSIYTAAPSTAADTIYVTISTFTIPAVAGTVNVDIVRPYTGTVPTLNVGVTNNFPAFGITAAGNTPLAANDILLVNIEETPGTPIVLGATLSAVPRGPRNTASGIPSCG